MPPPSESTAEIKSRIQGEKARLPAEHIWLFVAAIAVTATMAGWLDATPRLDSRAAASLLLVAGIAACGYLIRSAEARVSRMLGRALADAATARRDGYAEGFIDGARANGAVALRSATDPTSHSRRGRPEYD